MLELSDNWSWYFDTDAAALFLELSDDLLFRCNLRQSALIPSALQTNEFNVEDATAFQLFEHTVTKLDLSHAYQAELTLNCVAAKRFQKPLQPKSWFFELAETNHQAQEGELIVLNNSLNSGHFVVIDSGQGASTCIYAEQTPFHLSENKTLKLGDSIRVMNDRVSEVVVSENSRLIA
jgi:cell division protein ZapC